MCSPATRTVNTPASRTIQPFCLHSKVLAPTAAAQPRRRTTKQCIPAEQQQTLAQASSTSLQSTRCHPGPKIVLLLCPQQSVQSASCCVVACLATQRHPNPRIPKPQIQGRVATKHAAHNRTTCESAFNSPTPQRLTTHAKLAGDELKKASATACRCMACPVLS